MSLNVEQQGLLRQSELLVECKQEMKFVLYQGVGFALGVDVYFHRQSGNYIAALFRNELSKFNMSYFSEEENPDDEVVKYFREAIKSNIENESSLEFPPSITREQLLEYAMSFRSHAVFGKDGRWRSKMQSDTIFPLVHSSLPDLLPPKLYLAAFDQNLNLMFAPQSTTEYRHTSVTENAIISWAREHDLDVGLCYLMERIVVLNPDGFSSGVFIVQN